MLLMIKEIQFEDVRSIQILAIQFIVHRYLYRQEIFPHRSFLGTSSEANSSKCPYYWKHNPSFQIHFKQREAVFPRFHLVRIFAYAIAGDIPFLIHLNSTIYSTSGKLFNMTFFHSDWNIKLHYFPCFQTFMLAFPLLLLITNLHYCAPTL